MDGLPAMHVNTMLLILISALYADARLCRASPARTKRQGRERAARCARRCMRGGGFERGHTCNQLHRRRAMPRRASLNSPPAPPAPHFRSRASAHGLLSSTSAVRRSVIDPATDSAVSPSLAPEEVPEPHRDRGCHLSPATRARSFPPRIADLNPFSTSRMRKRHPRMTQDERPAV
jgi:hypothetical protein